MFVHARNATVKTATVLRDMASSQGDQLLFKPDQTPQLGLAEKQVNHCSLCILEKFLERANNVYTC